jgi:hypothetical protein
MSHSHSIFRAAQRQPRLRAELLNVTNNASPSAMTVSRGQQYGRITTISTPRIARFGFTFSF